MASIEQYLNRRLQGPPKEEIGIGGFTTLVRITERYNLSAEAPSTPVEDGSYVNDHIILKPLVLSLTGDVSDVHLRSSPLVSGLRDVTRTIGDLSAQFLPAWTQSQLSRINALANDTLDAVRRIDSAMQSGQTLLNYFSGNRDAESASLQQQFVTAMESLFFGRQVFPVDMPFRRHENMMITNLVLDYDNQTDATKFSLDLQQIQFVESRYAAVESIQPAAGTNGQTNGVSAQGAQAGEPVEQERSLWSAVLGR